MVDDEGRAGGVDPRGQRAEPVDAAGVEHDEQLGRLGDRARRDDEAVGVEGAQRLRRAVRGAERDVHADAATVQRETEGQRAAERVGVGVDVGEQDDVGGRREHRGGLVERHRPRAPTPAH